MVSIASVNHLRCKNTANFGVGDGICQLHPFRESIKRIFVIVIRLSKTLLFFFESTYIQSSLKFPRRRRKAVENEIFAHAVNEFASRTDDAANKVTAFSFTTGERSHDLSLHVHYDDRIWPTADDEMLRISGQQLNVHCRVRAHGLISAYAFSGFQIPDLDGAIWWGTENAFLFKLWGQCLNIIYKRVKLFSRLRCW